MNSQKTNPQKERNEALIAASRYMKSEVTSEVLPLTVDIANAAELTAEQLNALNALSIRAGRTAIKSLASLAEIGELDHLGGALELIPSLMLTLAITNYENTAYTIEHAHTSIGYFSALAALGFVDEDVVVNEFRRSLDIPGHVSWLPGGTQLNGGRLGVMVPVAVGQALGLQAKCAEQAFVVCHCGDAGWISGQALNGFNGASVQGAPTMFIMHRNGIQLSGSTAQIMNLDPRPVIQALGIEIIEIPTLYDFAALYAAYRQGYELARQGRPSMIYPAGYRSDGAEKVTVAAFGEKYGVAAQTAAFAEKNGVALDTEVWIPGSLMSYRDVGPMLECLFLVNDLPGGAGHHDGHMKNRDAAEVLANPMFQMTPDEEAALASLEQAPKRVVVTKARPAPGSANLILSAEALAEVALPPAGKSTSPRGGSQEGYAAVAKAYPENVFVVSCDLDPSTKLGKARTFLAPGNQFEMGIEEQVSALMADGLALSGDGSGLNVFSTFAAFYEGIAREGFELWRYQRNLNGANEGLNVCMHLSHVGACTGRDHFSGWSLDWINLALGYLPYLHRFYAPADARAAFLAVKDLAAHYGGHIIGIPRDNLPVLAKQDGSGPLWEAADEWEPTTQYREFDGAKKAILAFGAPASLAGEAADSLNEAGEPVDVIIINGLPLKCFTLKQLCEKYPEGLATIEDGIIATPLSGLRGFASLACSAVKGRAPLAHIGITDPTIAPADGHPETWAHFGITTQALIEAVKGL